MNPFAATVDHVIDGDTLYLRVRCRTRNSAPELNSAAGVTAKAALEKNYPQRSAVAVTIVAVDSYGRPVVTLAKDS